MMNEREVQINGVFPLQTLKNDGISMSLKEGKM